MALAIPIATARAQTANPDVSCSYSGPPANTLQVTLREDPGDELLIKRVGDQIQAFDVGLVFHHPKGKKKGRFVPALSPFSCNGTATVHNTDLIDVVDQAEVDYDIDISLEGGPLAPGATPEADGTSEIETRVESLGPGQRVTFIGGPEADWFRYGANQGVEGVNLNAQDEAASPDVDATLSLAQPETAVGTDWPGAFVRMGAGNDTFTTTGGPEFDSPLTGGAIGLGGSGDDQLISSTTQFTGLNGGPGNDTIQGNGAVDIIRAGKGRDVVTGGSGQDFVELGKGHDVVSTGPGKDVVSAFDHTRDWVSCGPGRDGVGRDRSDRVPGCERRVVRPFGIPIFSD